MMLLLKLQAQGRHGRSTGKGSKGALDEERWGPDLPGGRLWMWGGGTSLGDIQQGEACSYGHRPPIEQVAASQILLLFLITEDLAPSQDGGGSFDSSWGRESKPERTPAKQVMGGELRSSMEKRPL